MDSWILLAKLNYALGNYTDSLKYYEKAQVKHLKTSANDSWKQHVKNDCSSVQIESLEEKQLPARSLKIMAEAFAIKGLCYEKLPLQVQEPF